MHPGLTTFFDEAPRAGCVGAEREVSLTLLIFHSVVFHRFKLLWQRYETP